MADVYTREHVVTSIWKEVLSKPGIETEGASSTSRRTLTPLLKLSEKSEGESKDGKSAALPIAVDPGISVNPDKGDGAPLDGHQCA